MTTFRLSGGIVGKIIAITIVALLSFVARKYVYQEMRLENEREITLAILAVGWVIMYGMYRKLETLSLLPGKIQYRKNAFIGSTVVEHALQADDFITVLKHKGRHALTVKSDLNRIIARIPGEKYAAYIAAEINKELKAARPPRPVVAAPV